MRRRAPAFVAAALAASCGGGSGSPVLNDSGAASPSRIERAGDGLPYFVRGGMGRVRAPIADVAAARAALAPVLPAVAAQFGLGRSALEPFRVHRDRLGMTHIWLAQIVDGRPVIGGDLVVHLATDGTVRSATGAPREPRAIGAVPAVDPSIAAATAVAGTAAGRADAGTPALVYVVATATGAVHLAWQVTVTGRDALIVDDVFVDAGTGRIVDRRPRVFTARNRTVWDGEGGVFPFVFDPVQIGTEASPPSDTVGRAAYDNTGTTYDCYQELFDRDSYDDAGAELRSLVHVSFLAPGGSTPNNAAWTGDQMVYGDGDGELMAPLALAFDVTAHELTHGVTSATANLAYQNESGALNEAWSDILAAVCEAWDDGAVSADTWLVGEDIFTPDVPGDGLRFMADPTADAALYPPELGGSRDFYPDRYMGAEDNGGVHLNSGIANLAFQLLVDGGTHPRDQTTFTVPGIGITQAGAIFERALTAGYLTTNSNFAQARTLTEEVAGELFEGTVVTAVGMAWAAVGVGAPPVTDEVPPTVEIVDPADGAEVEAGFTVAVEAADDVGVDRVELSVDGTVVGTDSDAPYEFTTDAGLAPGAHTLEATAYDLFNSASDTATVTIGDDPVACPGGCDDGEVCDEDEGVCVPEANPGDDDGSGGGGCCSAGTDRSGATASLVMFLAVAFGLRRRRRGRARR
jgi:uncharacterized protein (TIGR03382 family)